MALDDPICACLLLLYLAAAATNMTIFQVNRKRDHKFIFSALLFGFCMARTATLVMRIVWASRPANVNVAIAASILVQAGVLLLFVVNLVFAQRLVRSYHPHLGWSPALTWAFRLLYFCVFAMLVMVITATVDSFFTLDARTRRDDRDIQLVAATFLAALAFLPFPVTLLAVALAGGPAQAQAHAHAHALRVILNQIHHHHHQRPEKFGQGRHRTKVWLLLFTSALLSLGAGFRVGVSYTAPRPAADPAWYHSKACFYCFNFALELVVVYTYTVSRFDRRFHVPNGSSGPGHYSGVRVVDEEGKGKKERGAATGTWEVNRELDVFGDEGRVEDQTEEIKKESEWEARATAELNRIAVD